jgi:membrane protease YdiL (CAAX protease family)
VALPINRFFFPLFLSLVFSVIAFVLFTVNISQALAIAGSAFVFGSIAVLTYRFFDKLAVGFFALFSAIILIPTFIVPAFYIVDSQLALFFLSLHLLWKTDLKTTLKKLALPGNIGKNVLYGFVGFFSVLILSAIITSVLAHLIGFGDAQKIVSKVDSLPTYILLVAIFVAPFSEEFFFRAVLTERFGVVLSSLAFMLSHIAYGSITELVGAFVLGLIFAVVYKRSKSTTPCIIMHFLYNFAALAFSGLI